MIGSHATLAVFGAVLTTVLGALSQLATMFTQTDLHEVDTHLRRIEEWGYPLGVVELAVGVVGFVVFGTLYHVVPFTVWVHRYSDLLGYEPVPMVDNLYSGRLAAVDFAFTTGGTVTLVASALGWLPSPSVAIGGGLFAIGALCFVANMGQVLRDHSPESIPELLLGTFWTDRSCASEGPADSADRR